MLIIAFLFTVFLPQKIRERSFTLPKSDTPVKLDLGIVMRREAVVDFVLGYSSFKDTLEFFQELKQIDKEYAQDGERALEIARVLEDSWKELNL